MREIKLPYKAGRFDYTDELTALFVGIGHDVILQRKREMEQRYLQAPIAENANRRYFKLIHDIIELFELSVVDPNWPMRVELRHSRLLRFALIVYHIAVRNPDRKDAIYSRIKGEFCHPDVGLLSYESETRAVDWLIGQRYKVECLDLPGSTSDKSTLPEFLVEKDMKQTEIEVKTLTRDFGKPIAYRSIESYAQAVIDELRDSLCKRPTGLMININVLDVKDKRITLNKKLFKSELRDVSGFPVNFEVDGIRYIITEISHEDALADSLLIPPYNKWTDYIGCMKSDANHLVAFVHLTTPNKKITIKQAVLDRISHAVKQCSKNRDAEIVIRLTEINASNWPEFIRSPAIRGICQDAFRNRPYLRKIHFMSEDYVINELMEGFSDPVVSFSNH